jgi:signal transduction histidine kinase
LGTAVWLAAVEQARRRPEPWPAAPVAWFSGDAAEHRPQWPMQALPEKFADVVAPAGNALFRVQPEGRVSLGRWAVKDETLSWSFRVRLPTNRVDGVPPNYAFARLANPRFRLQLGLRGGAVVVHVGGRGEQASAGWEFTEFAIPGAQPGQWQQLGLVREKYHLRAYVDGRLALDKSLGSDFPSPHLAEFQFLLGPDANSTDAVQPLVAKNDPALFDDVALFDRKLSDPEMVALAAAAPGEWAGCMHAEDAARRRWSLGWPWVAAAAAGLLAGGLSTTVAAGLGAVWRAVPDPAFRPVWLVLLVGGIGTGVVTAELHRRSAAADRARFAEAALLFNQAVDTYFERVADLVNRARDWVAAQPELSPAAWDRWCAANKLDSDYSGLLGLGYAEQVLPAQESAREAVWSARHGLPFAVWPKLPAGARWRPPRLQGEPRLPVVLYAAVNLDPSVWRTNGSILGRDLLAASPEGGRDHAEPWRLEDAIADGAVNGSDLEEIAPAGWYGGAVAGLRLYAALITEATPQTDRPIPPDRWRGVVFASADPRRWLGPVLRDTPGPLGFRLYVADGFGQAIEPVVDSGELAPETAWRTAAYLTGEREIPHYGRRLVAKLWTTPMFEAQSQRRWPWFSAATGGGFTLLTAGLLFVQVRGRRREAAAAAQLALAHGELSRLSRERERLSRDLHDGTIQSLYAVGLHLQHAQRHLTAAPEKAAHGLEDGRHLVQDTIVELRQFLLALQDERGTPGQTFGEAMESLLPRLRRTTPVEFDLEVAPAAGALPARVVLQLVNVVRECLSNALRHGRPGRIGIALRRGAGIYCLEVSDDGQGFEPAKVAGGGFGLRTLRERAAELGGTLAVTSAPGHGASVRLEFPAPAPAPTAELPLPR